MDYIYICPNCGLIFRKEDKIEHQCPTCNVSLVYSDYTKDEWYQLPGTKRAEIVMTVKTAQRKGTNGIVYSIDGVRGRHIDVYEDRCVITVNVGIGSFLTGNVSDGEKTIYYVDCIGVQFKQSGLQIGYLQLETASGLMNNRRNNFFNENSFTFDTSVVSNNMMEEVAEYVKSRITAYKQAKVAPVVAPASPADEIKKFKELLDMGIITQAEFDAKKKQLLGQ